MMFECGGARTLPAPLRLPWHIRVIWRFRDWLASRLTDLASWVAGRDVRDYW